MPRLKGSPKTGGRKIGVPNKRSGNFAKRLSDLGIDVIEEIAILLPVMDADRKSATLLALLPYIYPKLSPVEVKDLESKDVNGLTDEELISSAKELIQGFETETNLHRRVS